MWSQSTQLPQRPVSSAVSVAHLTVNDSCFDNDRQTTRPAPTDGLTALETDTKAKSCDTGMCSQGNSQTEHAQWRESESENGSITRKPKDSFTSSDSDSGVESALSSPTEITNQSPSDFEVIPTETAVPDLEPNICSATPPPSLAEANHLECGVSKPLAVDSSIAARPIHPHSACEQGEASAADFGVVASPSPSPIQVPHYEEGSPNPSTESTESSAPLIEANYSNYCERDIPSPKATKTVHFATPLVTEVIVPTCEENKPLTANAAPAATTEAVCFATPFVAEAVHFSEEDKPLLGLRATAKAVHFATPLVADAVQSACEEGKPLMANTSAKIMEFAKPLVSKSTFEENKPLTVNTVSVAAAKPIHFPSPLVSEVGTLSACEQRKPLATNTIAETARFATSLVGEATHSHGDSKPLVASGTAAAAKTVNFCTPLMTEVTLSTREQNRPLTAFDTDITAVHSTPLPPSNLATLPVNVSHHEGSTPEASDVSVASVDFDSDLSPLTEATSSHPAIPPPSPAHAVREETNSWTPDTVITGTVNFFPLPYSQSGYVSKWDVENGANGEVSSTGSVESLPPLIGDDDDERGTPSAVTAATVQDAPSMPPVAQAAQQVSNCDDSDHIDSDDFDDCDDSDEEEEMDEEERIASLFMSFYYHDENKRKRSKKKAALVADEGTTATAENKLPTDIAINFDSLSLSPTDATFPPCSPDQQNSFNYTTTQPVPPPTTTRTAYGASAASADVAVNMESISLPLPEDTCRPAAECESNPLAACTGITATVECLSSPPLVQAAYKPPSSDSIVEVDTLPTFSQAVIPTCKESNNNSMLYAGAATVSIDDCTYDLSSLPLTEDSYTACGNSNAALPYTTATAYYTHSLPTTDSLSMTDKTSTTAYEDKPMFVPDDGDLHVHDHDRRKERPSYPLHHPVKTQCSRSTFSFTAFTVSLLEAGIINIIISST